MHGFLLVGHTETVPGGGGLNIGSNSKVQEGGYWLFNTVMEGVRECFFLLVP